MPFQRESIRRIYIAIDLVMLKSLPGGSEVSQEVLMFCAVLLDGNPMPQDLDVPLNLEYPAPEKVTSPDPREVRLRRQAAAGFLSLRKPSR